MKEQGTNSTTLGLEENLLELEPSQIKPYLSGLNRALSHLSAIIDKERDGGATGFVDPDFILNYLSIVRNSIECLALKHELTGYEKVDFGITIDPTDSGFPRANDFFLLGEDKREAETFLQSLPDEGKVLDMMRTAIFTGNPEGIASVQTLLRRRRFSARVVNTNVLNEFFVSQVKPLEEEKGTGRQTYNVEWSCIELGSNVPVLYRLCLTQNRGCTPLDESMSPFLLAFIKKTAVHPDMEFFLSEVDGRIDELHPKLFEKYTIGPYYCPATKNPKKINSLFKLVDEPFALKFSIQKALSRGVKTYGKWIDNAIARLRGEKLERESFSDVYSVTKMLVPFRIKQELGNRDENGNKCSVYGVTNGGEIVV